ncbi:MAG: hypothetical protein ACRD3G_28280 [Vicinamibacterales bacterium]
MALRVAAALAALAVTGAVAQQPDSLPQRPTTHVVNLQDAQADVPEPPEPPPGANSWSLRIHTSGGFTGQGIGSVTITSNGQMACGPAPCATPLLERFAKAIVSAVAEPWGGLGPSTICSDCIRTTIVLKRRDGDVVRVYRTSWDDSQPVTPQLRELRRLAFELRAAR